MKGQFKGRKFRPTKKMGQNFLINPDIPLSMIDSWKLEEGVGVLEIGPGTGALTMPLLARGLTVVAVEKDLRLCELLAEKVNKECDRGEIRIVNEDILRLNPAESLRWDGAPKKWVLVGNLPYSISTPVFEWTIKVRDFFGWVSYMVQREYGQRILAVPRTKAYSSLTLWVGYHFMAERLLDVAADNFWPRPKVDSVVLRLTPFSKPPVVAPSAEALERVVRAGFMHRRKMLAGSLGRAFDLPRAEVENAMTAAGISITCRPEECTLAEFAALSRALASCNE